MTETMWWILIVLLIARFATDIVSWVFGRNVTDILSTRIDVANDRIDDVRVQTGIDTQTEMDARNIQVYGRKTRYPYKEKN